MKTNEQIASEVVNRLIHVAGMNRCEIIIGVPAERDFADGGRQLWEPSWSYWTPPFPSEAAVQRAAGTLRRIIASQIIAAIEESQRLPIPSPVSAGRLDRIRELNAEAPTDWGQIDAVVAIDDLLAHIDHLTRALFDCGQDGSLTRWSEGYSTAWKAGFAAGTEAQKEADTRAVTKEAKSHRINYDRAIKAIINEPLVSPPPDA